MVIDLTNSFRYYNHREWEDNGVMYAKVDIPVHDLRIALIRATLFPIVAKFWT